METKEQFEARMERERRIKRNKSIEAAGIMVGAGVLDFVSIIAGLHMGDKAAERLHPIPQVTYLPPEKAAEEAVIDVIARESIADSTPWPEKRIIEEYTRRLPEELQRRADEQAAAYKPAEDAKAAQKDVQTQYALGGIGVGGALAITGAVSAMTICERVRRRREELKGQGQGRS